MVVATAPRLSAAPYQPAGIGRRVTVERPEQVGEVVLPQPEHHAAFGLVPAFGVRRVTCAPELNRAVVAFGTRSVEVTAEDPRALAGRRESGVQRLEHLDLDQTARRTRRQVRDMELELGSGAADAHGQVTLGELQSQPGADAAAASATRQR